MSDERTQDLVETLQDPFPRPTGFSRLLILRSESAPSMAITTILLLSTLGCISKQRWIERKMSD